MNEEVACNFLMNHNIHIYTSVVVPEQIDQEKMETNKEVHTNATVLSKQIKIMSQLNAKQVDTLISLIVFLSDINTSTCFAFN